MSTSIPGDLNLVSNDGQSTDEVINALVEAVNGLSEQVSSLSEELDSVKDELTEEKEERRRLSKENAELRQEVNQLEERLESSDPKGDDGNNGGIDRYETIQPDSPLEHMVSMPQALIEEQESPNVSRATFLARDVAAYSKKCPKGRVITSREMGIALKSGTDANESGIRTTVKRVMSFLDRLGKDGIEVIKRRGMKRVVFTEECADRLSKLASSSQQARDGVVTGGVA